MGRPEKYITGKHRLPHFKQALRGFLECFILAKIHFKALKFQINPGKLLALGLGIGNIPALLVQIHLDRFGRFST